MNHDQPIVQAVLGITMPQDESLTASITGGGAFFKVVNITAYDLVLEQVDRSELPPGHKGPLFYWTQQNPITSDGVKPLAVKQGQRVYLGVSVDVPNGAVPPGPFAGAAVLNGGSFSRTVDLHGTCLAVDLHSPIGQKWQAMGGEATFGDVLSNAHAAADGKGTVQEFANGALYQVPTLSSLHIPIPTVILRSSSSGAVFRAQGPVTAPIGRMVNRVKGYPPPEHPAAVSPRDIRHFGPPLPPLVSINVFYLSNDLYAKWQSLANAKDALGNRVWDALGFPTEDTFNTTEGGRALRYQGGVVVVRANEQAWVVYGAIYAHYAQLGNLADPQHQPFVGFPTSDELQALPNRGRVSHFDGADIYWDGNTGAHEVHGAIRQHWTDLGGAGGFLGFPLTDETGTPDGVGRFNRFEGGVMYWTPSTGAHEVHGAILDRWSMLGFERSYLGYPVSDEINWSLPGPVSVPGRGSHFQFGWIGWTAQFGADEVPDAVVQSQQVLTPSGTALGGTVQITLWSNGNYLVQFHMHDSGLVGYDFQVHAIFTTSQGLSLVAAHSGHVEGTDSWRPGYDPQRDDDHTDSGNNSWIQMHWADISSGTLQVTKDYSATGIIGFFEDLGQAILGAAAGAVDGALGIVIGIGSEISQVFDNLGLGGAFGVIAGTIVFAFGGSIVLAVVAGVAIGAVTNAVVKQRQISQLEYDTANAVFQGTLSPPSKLILTNFSGLGGRAFTMPGIDGNIYINLGDGYEDPLNYTTLAYPNKGQLLVHELTHAWQITHASFVPGFVCQGIVNQIVYIAGQDVYIYGPPGPPWGSFNLEAQGAIVDQWFGGCSTPVVPNRTAMNPKDPYFGYIANNVRRGQI